MHRTARIVPLVALSAASTLLTTGLTGLAVGPAHAAQAPRPITKETADTRAEQRDVQRYWTTAKMAAAEPLDDLAAKPNGVRLSMAPPARTGPPITFKPTAPVPRVLAPNAPGTPWTARGAVTQTTGRVFFTVQGRNASCSGSAVTSANRSVVMTAGHCVRMDGAFHGNWVFVPGYNRGNRPFGTWVATTLLTTQQWSAREDINHDVAAAVVAPLDGKRLTEVVGGQGIAFNQARRRQMYAFGYPGGAPYDGSTLIYCSGRAFDDTRISRDLGLRCDMTGGSSGGPWLTAFDEATGLGTQNSVNSFKYNFAANVMFGPYFGPEAKQVYQSAAAVDAT